MQNQGIRFSPPRVLLSPDLLQLQVSMMKILTVKVPMAFLLLLYHNHLIVIVIFLKMVVQIKS